MVNDSFKINVSCAEDDFPHFSCIGSVQCAKRMTSKYWVRFTQNDFQDLVAFTVFSAQCAKDDLRAQGKVHPAPAPVLLTGDDDGTCDIDKIYVYMSRFIYISIYMSIFLHLSICQCELISEQ